MSPNDDPIHDIDPRFPDRPNTPEFWLLSKIVNELDDGAALNGADIRPFMERLHRGLGITDRGAGVGYIAPGRIKHALGHNFVSPETLQLMESIWYDAFVVGACFAKGGVPTGQTQTEVLLQSDDFDAVMLGAADKIDKAMNSGEINVRDGALGLVEILKQALAAREERPDLDITAIRVNVAFLLDKHVTATWPDGFPDAPRSEETP